MQHSPKKNSAPPSALPYQANLFWGTVLYFFSNISSSFGSRGMPAKYVIFVVPVEIISVEFEHLYNSCDKINYNLLISLPQKNNLQYISSSSSSFIAYNNTIKTNFKDNLRY